MSFLFRSGSPGQKAKSAVELLAIRARDTFKCAYGTPEYDEGIGDLVKMMTAITPEDVRASPAVARPPVAYASICHNALFTMGIFYLKKGETIPLHDHPGMTVLSRVLYGNIRIRSFDWMLDDESKCLDMQPTRLRAAPLREFDPPLRKVVQGNNILMSGSDAMNTRVLFPVHGNVHAIEALTDACFLDILAPPYAQGERDCHYYRDYAAAEIDTTASEDKDGREIRYLAETDASHFYCGHTAYSGPTFQIPP